MSRFDLDSFSRSLASDAADGPADRRGFFRKLAAIFAGGAVLAVAGDSEADARVVCPPGLKKCGNKCRTTYNDPDNCGTCGHSCAADEVCRKGVCVSFGTTPTVCGAGETNCSGTCADLDVDPDNCGTCGNACGVGETCASGSCTAAPECSSASECGTDTECVSYTCNGGVCGAVFANVGTPVSGQTAGDCKKVVCDGVGGTMEVTADEDVPASLGPCDVATCVAGVPVHTPQDALCGSGEICFEYACVPVP